MKYAVFWARFSTYLTAMMCIADIIMDAHKTTFNSAYAGRDSIQNTQGGLWR